MKTLLRIGAFNIVKQAFLSGPERKAAWVHFENLEMADTILDTFAKGRHVQAHEDLT